MITDEKRYYEISLSPKEVDLVRAAICVLKEDIVAKMRDYGDGFKQSSKESSDEYMVEMAHTVAMFEACIKDYRDLDILLKRVMQLTL